MSARDSQENTTPAIHSASTDEQDGGAGLTAEHEALPHDLSLMPARLELSHCRGLEPVQPELEAGQPGLHVADAAMEPDSKSPSPPVKTPDWRICGLKKRTFFDRTRCAGPHRHRPRGKDGDETVVRLC